MQTLVTKTATEAKKLQSRRNLFGLGVTSLIAACAADESTGGDEPEIKNGMTVTPTATLPFEAVKLEKAPELSAGSSYTGTKSGFTTTKGGDQNQLTVAISGTKDVTLTFNDGAHKNARGAVITNAANIHQLTTTKNQYDLVVSSRTIDSGKGGIFIFWNVDDIRTGTIGAGSTNQKRLEIKGATAAGDYIGSFPPEFLQIRGEADNYDMIVRSGSVTNDTIVVGAIYILWDVATYANTDKLSININSLALATAGSLAIYGAAASDFIGTHEPEFLQIRGEANKYDMVIRSNNAEKDGNGNEGAIFILWDVNDYPRTEPLNHTITLDSSATGATSGSLTIYGARPADYIGTSAPEFLQIGGEVDNYDMVISAHEADKPEPADKTNSDEGAIYILWDVADYYSAETGKENKSIDLTPDDATSGLLTIYGRGDGLRLGENDARNILYKTVAGNKTLTNIDKDTDGTEGDAGTIDIAITDGMYTYVFFGNQIAATTDEGDNITVTSKSIDLAKIADLDLSMSENKGYFEYKFGTDPTDILTHDTATAATKANATGYRFANANLKTLDAVQNDTSSPFASSLSGADADLGVWDIA